MTGPWTNGATAVTCGSCLQISMDFAQSSITDSLLTTRWASKPITFRRSSCSNPVITEITRIRTIIPSVTPRIEMSVMIERNVRFGFR